jgi:hypothetical protein
MFEWSLLRRLRIMLKDATHSRCYVGSYLASSII